MSEYRRPLALALLCILALGLAAATLASPVDVGGDQGDAQSGNSSVGSYAVNGSSDYAGSNWNLTVYEDESLCYEPLVETPMWVVLVLAALLVAGVTTLRSNAYWGVALGGLSLAPVIIIIIILTAGCPGTIPGPPEAQNAASDTAEETQEVLTGLGPGSEGGLAVSTPTLLVGGLVVLTVVILTASLFLFEEESDEESDPDYEFEAEQPEAIGRIAGEAVEEIESNEGLHNEVYRAWAKMAGELDVDHPERSTPTEFAAAARDAGVDPADIEKLTVLFEEVRYSTAEPTPERERRALEALRRIEHRYAADSDGTDRFDTHSTDSTDGTDSGDGEGT